MSLLVVDASVVVKWFLPEIHSVAALRVASGAWTFLAPDLLDVEVTNTFWKKHRRGELTHDEGARLIDDLRHIDIAMVPHRPLLSMAFALAAAVGHPVYDCVYLALAEQNDCQLVTADRRFYKAFAESKWRRRLSCIEDQ
ncbi:MAG: type II toxin-antitoxin system VapC family toxin [Alphaproteobacteria bacterium]